MSVDLDSSGKETPTGAWCAFVPFVPALNDAEGEWTVRVTDLLAGTVAERKFRLSGGLVTISK